MGQCFFFLISLYDPGKILTKCISGGMTSAATVNRAVYSMLLMRT